MAETKRLTTDFVVLNQDFNADVVAVTPELYARLDEEYAEFAGHLLISTHTFEADWPTWETHPAGDEFVVLLSGDVELILALEGGDDVTRMNEPGTFVIVPRDTWHTARVHAPSMMLFVTPGEGTVNAEQPVRSS